MDQPYFGLKSPGKAMAGLGFDELRQRLIRFVIGKIRNGEYTERGLARQIGVSQSQLHNVLKGVRVLKPELGDLLLGHLDITLIDLLSPLELNAARRRVQRTLAGWTPHDNSTLLFETGSTKRRLASRHQIQPDVPKRGEHKLAS